MANDLIIRVGEKRRISHKVSAASAFTIASATISIYDSSGTADVAAAACTIDPVGSDDEHEVYYVWDCSAGVADDYTYSILYTVGSEIGRASGQVIVLPAVSKFDRYVQRVNDWLLQSEVSEAAQDVSWVQMRDSLKETVNAYSRKRPYRQQATQAMAGSTWEYALPSDWTDEFSQIERLEYPVDSTEQTRFWMEPRQFAVDELRNKWYFATIIPSTGETARLYYTGLHVIRDAVGEVAAADTVPAPDFHSFCQYAAGLCLRQLASGASHTLDPNIGAAVTNARDKQLKYSQQADAYLREAQEAWNTSRRSFGAQEIAF